MSTTANSEDGWTAGKIVRVCESHPPVLLEPARVDGEGEPGWVRGKVVRVCDSLSPVECVPAPLPTALVLRVPEATDAVADVLLRVVNADWLMGGHGLTRDRSRETHEPGVVTLALVPEGPINSDTEARLRELARAITSSTVTAIVVPAA